jgi:hypothetical protein
MDTPLQSQQWYRVAGLRPRWRLHVRADRQPSRGAVWHVLSNAAVSAKGACAARRTPVVQGCGKPRTTCDAHP